MVRNKAFLSSQQLLLTFHARFYSSGSGIAVRTVNEAEYQKYSAGSPYLYYTALSTPSSSASYTCYNSLNPVSVSVLKLYVIFMCYRTSGCGIRYSVTSTCSSSPPPPPQTTSASPGCQCSCCSGPSCTPTYVGNTNSDSTCSQSCTSSGCSTMFPTSCPSTNSIVSAKCSTTSIIDSNDGSVVSPSMMALFLSVVFVCIALFV